MDVNARGRAEGSLRAREIGDLIANGSHRGGEDPTGSRDLEGDPVAFAALSMIGDGVDQDGLERRFQAAGVPLVPGSSIALLQRLADLGLVRPVPAGDAVRWVATTLGRNVREAGPTWSLVDALEELERLRGDFLATIAHELRTPLTAIRTCVGLLRDPLVEPDEAEHAKLLETIERNADRMQRLVTEVLDLARFRSGQIQLQLRRFDARTIAADGVTEVRPLLESRAQRAELIAPAHPVWVYGDRRRLEQALLNLISNAQKFSPHEGVIRVTTAIDGHAVRWTVADEGPGISAPDQARLFERFFVGRSDRSSGSTGLGLPTALAIAQAHEGRIEVESEPGRGSRFSLIVPAAGPPGLDP